MPRAALDGIPRAIGAFCQELDLQLVHLAPEDSRAWRCVLAWSDEVGRPRFMSARICSDYCRGLRCYLRAEELLDASAETLFSHALVDAVERGELTAEHAAWLCSQWNEDPRGAIERVARFWPDAANIRLIAQAAKHGEWAPVRAALAPLRRALRRAVLPEPADALARVAVLARSLAEPAQAAVVFMGRESPLRSAVLADVKRDLAPLGLKLFEAGAQAPARAAPRGFRPGQSPSRRDRGRQPAGAGERDAGSRAGDPALAGMPRGAPLSGSAGRRQPRSRRGFCSSPRATASRGCSSS